MRTTPKPSLIFEASVLFCLVLGMLASSCKINRQGLLEPQMKFTVEPQLFCPGDPVTVSWDFTGLSRSPDNCRPALRRCESNADCRDPASEDCVDNFCCARTAHVAGVENCPTAEGCPPAFNVTITADTLTLAPPVESESTDLSGSRTVTPGATTIFTMNADITPPVRIMRETRTAKMVTRTPETNHIMEFLFQCGAGGRPGWQTINVDSPRLASENVRIINVRNTSRHFIVVTGGEPLRGPITLSPGESTDTFNGTVRGIWSAQLAPSDPARAIVPTCAATNISNPWPDLRIELILDCVVGG